MLLKTLLNKVEKYSSFVYSKIVFEKQNSRDVLIIAVKARKDSRGKCPQCLQRCPSYDRSQRRRLFSYVPIWGFPVYLSYHPRRVKCKIHGIVTEHLPWAKGKERITNSHKIFLAVWAKRLSWAEVAKIFNTSWDTVFSAVRSLVDWGLEKRSLEDITTIGIDEVHVFNGRKYMTLVYEIAASRKRLLWCAEDNTKATLERFFSYIGSQKTEKLRYICTDMLPAYLSVIRQKAPLALNILDRFHIMMKFNRAVDLTRRMEYRLNKPLRKDLGSSRWLFLKNEKNLSKNQFTRLKELLKRNLKSVKAYLLKKDFQQFWEFEEKVEAEEFLNMWCRRTNRTKLTEMKKVAKMLQDKQSLILNWFEANPRLSSGVIEGLNNKAKLTIKKAYGFKNSKYLKYALYNALGDLPIPESTHRFNC
jgi:transposase